MALALGTMVNREQGHKTVVNGLKSQQNIAGEIWRVYRIMADFVERF